MTLRQILATFTVYLGFSSIQVYASSTYSFISDHQLAAQWQDVERIWQVGKQGVFQGEGRVALNYRIFKRENAKAAVTIVSGRNESFYKYKETIFNLYQNGYSVYIFDHRGQGSSTRVLGDPEKGYVADFTSYIKDLKTFYKQFVHGVHEQNFLLSHSMGGLITALYLEAHPNDFQRAVLSSPMLDIVFPMPKWLACSIVAVQSNYNQLTGAEPQYALGQKPYYEKARVLAPADMTHSKARFNYKIQIANEFPATRLGGVTSEWITESCKASDDVIMNIDKIQIPILLLQAEEDFTVSNEAQNRFCALLDETGYTQCESGKPIVIKGAYHELLFEADEYRLPVLDTILSFYDSNN